MKPHEAYLGQRVTYPVGHGYRDPAIIVALLGVDPEGDFIGVLRDDDGWFVVVELDRCLPVEVS